MRCELIAILSGFQMEIRIGRNCLDLANFPLVASTDCLVSSWSTFTNCSVDCGGGSMTRMRNITQNATFGGMQCPDLNETMTCNAWGCSTLLESIYYDILDELRAN